ncbi:MAG: chain-length determining protein [Bacteroidaceae bacterium]|nr:chain-length determining protein [Bacteroidaceae bacterium]
MEEQGFKKQLLKEADLLLLAGKLLAKWKFIMKVTICFVIIGLVMALTSIKEYTSEVMVAPESSNSSFMSGGLGSLASIVGIDMGSMGGDDAIYPLLYPDIIQSLPFLSSLYDVRVRTLDGEVDTTYYYYKKNFQKIPWTAYIKQVPQKAMIWVKGLFTDSKKGGDPSKFDPYNLSEEQMRMIEKLNKSITTFVDKKTNVITVSFTDSDPLVAAMMTDTIMSRLQERITEYRTKKAINDCKYIEKLYNEAKEEYEIAQERYADFVDRNRNVVQERILVEKERLEADKTLKNTLYTQWAQQLLLAKAKVQEFTPAYTTLKPAAVPALPSSMRKLMIIIIYTFMGGMLAVGYVLLKEPVINICNKLFSFIKK